MSKKREANENEKQNMLSNGRLCIFHPFAFYLFMQLKHGVLLLVKLRSFLCCSLTLHTQNYAFIIFIIEQKKKQQKTHAYMALFQFAGFS